MLRINRNLRMDKKFDFTDMTYEDFVRILVQDKIYCGNNGAVSEDAEGRPDNMRIWEDSSLEFRKGAV